MGLQFADEFWCWSGLIGMGIPVPEAQISSQAAPTEILKVPAAEREALRTLIADAKNPESIPAGVKELTTVDPREDLRMRQRELNKEKKALTKVEKIRSDIEKNESSYSRWKQGIQSGLEKAEKRHMSVLQQLQTDLKMIEATGEDKMDGESEEEETEGSKALAKEVDEMKQHMGQMATYVQKMEQRNCELAQQMQFLISAVKDSRPFEPLTKDSPQIVRTPPGRALLAGGRRDDSKERSRSPMKRPAPDLVEQIEGLGEVPVVMAELLEQLPSEQHSQILAMVRAEPQRYNSPQAVMDLAASIQTQIAASIQVKGTFEAGNKSCASSAALQPFRRESKARLAKCQKGTESFRDEADDLGVRCLIFLCRLQVGGLGLIVVALNLCVEQIRDMYFPLLVDFRDQFLRRGTFVFFGRTFPTALQLFQAVSPQTDCFWGAECYVYVGSYGQERELTWNMVVPLYEGAYVRMVVIERPQPMVRQAESTCTPASDSGSARSDASSHDLFEDEDLAETEEILVSRDQTSFLQHGVQKADKWDQSCLHSLEENTATSLYPALAIESAGVDEEDELLWLMQSVAYFRAVSDFGGAAERGQAYLQELRLTRRLLTDAWLLRGTDLGYAHFRERENGIWEKKLIGWKYDHVDQILGQPFVIHLRRTGLWSSQIMSFFEDEGALEVILLTIFPPPLMLTLDGSSSALHDTPVLAFMHETFPSDMLPLVVRHTMTGQIETQSLRCLPGCCPMLICTLLGLQDRCADPLKVQIYFRLHDIERTFYGYERVGLPAGAYVNLELLDVATCREEMPRQYPLREHEVLLTPRQSEPFSQSTLEPHDLESLMQIGNAMTTLPLTTGTDAGSQVSDLFSVTELRATELEPVPLPEHEVLQLNDIIAGHSDVLKAYIRAHAGPFSRSHNPIYTWVLTESTSVEPLARVCIMQEAVSLSSTFLREWKDKIDGRTVSVSIATPVLPPPTLRVKPVDVLGIPSDFLDAGSWPCLVVSGLIQEIVLFLDVEFDEHLDFQSQTVKALIRSRVEPRVSPFSRVTMAAVRPPLTVREQDDSDDLYVLIGEELNPSSSLVMVVIWDHRQDESVDLHPLELPQRMMTEMLLEEVGMGRRCGLPFVECVVKHSEHELPLLISWRPFPGMKIVIDVGIKRCDIWQQAWSAGLSAASDFSLDGEAAWLMQRRILLRNNYDVLRQYASGWTTTTVELTFWFHNTVEERIQQHPAKAVFSVVTSDFQEDDFAQLIPRDGEIVPVDPAPILLVLPRPHILVLGVVAHQYVPVLCKVNIEGRQNLMSILVDSTYPPVSVDAIFDLVMPDHLCRSAAICHALYRDERKQFYHDIELQKGDFIELFSWVLDDDQTSCGDDSPESFSSDEIWDSSVMPHPSVLPEDINGDADFFSLMQTNPQTDRGVRIDAGHQLRLESDLLYRAVTSSSDHTLASVPQGGTAKLWLLAAEANGLHDTVIRVELRHQVPDWTGWVCGSWRNRPPGIRFVVMAERPPPISSENNDMLILGASARDMEQGKRVLLMDLIYSNVLRRGAVRFGILMTVAEIIRLFAGRSIPIDSPLLFAFEMYWFSPAGVRVYTASEIPSVPDGSYVRVVEKANPCRNAMRPLSPDPELVRWAEAAGTQTHESDAADNLDQDSMGLLQKSIRSDVRDNTATLDIEEMDGSSQDGRPYGLRPPLFRCYVFWCHQIADMLRPPGNTTVFWLSTDLDDLDDWVVYHGALFIIDSKFTSEKQVLSLNDRLDLPDNTPRGNEKVQPFEIALPDFTPFFDIIFQKRPKMDIVWEAVILALPEAVRVEAQELPGDHAAAWAVIVIGHGTGGDFILDCDYGLVVSEPMEQGWTGAQVSDARAAETAALIRAIEWTMYSGMEKPICFCFDAAAVGFAGTGTFRTGEADRHGRILRAMVAAIEKFLYWCQSLSFSWCVQDVVPYPIEQCWEELAAFLLSSPGRWKKILKKAVARHIGTRKLDAEWNAWHSTIMHEVLQVMRTGLTNYETTRIGRDSDGSWKTSVLKRSATCSATRPVNLTEGVEGEAEGRGAPSLDALRSAREQTLQVHLNGLNCLISLCGRQSSWRAALSVFQLAKPRTDLISVNAAMRAMNDPSRWAIALDLFAQLHRWRRRPDAVSCTAVMASELWQRAWRLFHTAGGTVRMDVISCSAAMSCCGCWRLSIEMFHRMSGELLEPNVISTNALITSCEKGLQWPLALEAFHELPALPGPDVVTFGALLSSFEKATQWLLALEAFDLLLGEGPEPNLVSYNSLIATCDKSSQWPLVLHLLEEMRNQSILPDLISYNAAISSCQDGNQWQLAVHLFDSLRRRRNTPSVVTFGSVISASGSDWTLALHFFQQMEDLLLQPNLLTCNALISCCEKSARWQMALQVFQQMNLQQMELDLVSYNALISSCEKGRQWQLALHFFEMIRDHLEPNVISSNALLSSCEKSLEWQKAIGFLMMMHEELIPGNIISYNAAVSSCDRVSRWPMAGQLLRVMATREVDADVISFNSALSSVRRACR
ncbi:unnamed protein product [Durusdinium trenchii]|uniref:RNase H type-1 domain-containing protein n=3 Tax=Durusdinium trenchii TaxID=1381693 RepID=A0ABP0Q116_9DINO